MREEKVKILVESVLFTPSVRVGVLEPLRRHQENGRSEVRFREDWQITIDDIIWADVVISVRGCELGSEWVAKAAEKAGRYVIYFLDDDLLDIPSGNGSSGYYEQEEVKESIIRTMNSSNLLWCVNHRIKEKYGKYVKDRAVVLDIPAQLPEKQRPVSGDNEAVRVLYAGSTDHRAVVREYLVPAIHRLSDEMGDRIEFIIIGPDPGLKRKNVKYHRFFENYDSYRDFVARSGCTVGLAPIRESDFYRAKYYNKFIEYTAIGAVGIYTDSEPYTLIVKQGQNGLLAKNTAEDWYEKIKYAAEHPEEIARYRQAAEQKIREEFSYEKIESDLLEMIPQLSEYRAKALKGSELYLPSMKQMFYGHKIKLHFKRYGIAALPVISYKAVRKVWRKLFETEIES